MGSTFTLSKWYMDCIDEDGNMFIGYAAFIRWKDISFNYSNSLIYTGKIRTSTSLMRVQAPVMNDDVLSWTSSGLKTKGEWKAGAAGVSELLIKNDKGEVDWNCVMPKAIAEVKAGDLFFKGLGYAEKLDMTMRPWDLPVQEIRWGRFVSENCYLVWIVWKGPVPLTIAYLDGEKINEVDVMDSHVMLPTKGIKLTFSDSVTLREGPVISTAFARLKWIRSFFPGNILNTFECKWRSRATLEASTNTHTGWAIHESVKWH